MPKARFAKRSCARSAFRKELAQPTAAAAPATPAKPTLTDTTAAEGKAPIAAPPPPETDAPKPSRGFQTLTNFVAQNAAMLLGAYPDPRTGEPMLDMEGARELIDMLDALRDTTRGNLAPEDERLLLDILGSLKLSYMEMTKAAAKATQERAKARSRKHPKCLPLLRQAIPPCERPCSVQAPPWVFPAWVATAAFASRAIRTTIARVLPCCFREVVPTW